MKGRSRKNPPYQYVTDAKWASLGTTMTVKEALDLWWNSIRIKVINTEGKEIVACIYKCCNGYYEVFDLADAFGVDDEAVLKLPIKLDEAYDEDADGYPIVEAQLRAIKINVDPMDDCWREHGDICQQFWAKDARKSTFLDRHRFTWKTVAKDKAFGEWCFIKEVI